jgi:hypothetical protein
MRKTHHFMAATLWYWKIEDRALVLHHRSGDGVLPGETDGLYLHQKDGCKMLKAYE